MKEEYTPKWLASQLGLKHVAVEIDRTIEGINENKVAAKELIVTLFAGEYERRKAESQKKEYGRRAFTI